LQYTMGWLLSKHKNVALMNTVAVIVKMVELNGCNSAGNIKKPTLCGRIFDAVAQLQLLHFFHCS